MSAAIDVVFENGVFRPLSPVNVPEGSRAVVYPIREDEQAARIVRTEGVCGGRARIDGTRITVWGLVAHRRNGMADDEILGAVPGLTREQLAAAWAYAAEHEAEIAADLLANDA